MQDLWLYKLDFTSNSRKYIREAYELRIGSEYKFPSGELFGNILRLENEEIKRAAIEELQSLKTNQKTKGERCPFLSLCVY